MATQREVYTWLENRRPFFAFDVIKELMEEFSITRKEAKEHLTNWMERIL